MFQNVVEFDYALLDAFGFICPGFLAGPVIHGPVLAVVQVFNSLFESPPQPNKGAGDNRRWTFLFSFHKSLVAGHRRSPMSQLGMLGSKVTPL